MKNKNKSNGPGRPAYTPNLNIALPFTFRKFCLAQGMEFTAKGKYIKGTGLCTPLTLRKFMDKRGCPVIQVKGEFAAPLSKKGLGRKAFMLTLRDGAKVAKVKVAKVKVAKVAKVQTTDKAKRKYTRKTPTATVDVGTGVSAQTQALEDIKAALATPSPALPPETPAAPVGFVPVLEVPAAPVAETPAAPVAETPTPAAPVAA
jgi:hypothetical protein